MLSGSILLSCLLLATDNGANPDGPIYMNSAKFEIPVTIAPERRRDIREIVLYEANPTRENPQPAFRRVATLTPREDKFPISNAPEGMHWYTIQIHYQNGKVEPERPNAAGALKIIVDTTRPEIHVKAERKGESIVGTWELWEDNADKPTLRMDYQMQEGGKWFPVGIEPDRVGRFEIPQVGTGPVKVRMLLRDLAGNVGQGDAFVRAAEAPPSPAPMQPPVRAVYPEASRLPEQPIPPASPTIVPQPTYQPQPIVPVFPQPHVQIVHSQPAGLPGIGGPVAGGSGTPLPLTVVSREKIKVEFDVARCGPSGLGSADVWLTADDGLTWKKMQSDEPLNLPPEEPLGGPIKAWVVVNIPQPEIVYGIYVVVKSKAGVGLPAPQQNTPPHLRVELDKLCPQAELRYPPVPKPGCEGILIISWKADDRNIEANPISLEYAEQKNGHWKPIGPPNLPNTGSYEWRLPSDIPGKVYLRLTVRDRAGLASQATTPEAVIVDTTPPVVTDFHVKGY